MLNPLNTHWRTQKGGLHYSIFTEKRIGFFGIHLAIGFFLVKVIRILTAEPHIRLGSELPYLSPCRYPGLQVGLIGILFKHIEKIAPLRVVVIALIHLGVSRTYRNSKRLIRFLGDNVDDSSCCPRTVEGRRRPFHHLNTFHSVQVEALVIEVARHFTRHTLAVHQEEDMACIQALHTYLVAETYLLDIHPRGFLHQRLLDIAITRFH